MTDFDRIDIDKSGSISREEWELEMTRRRLEVMKLQQELENLKRLQGGFDN